MSPCGPCPSPEELRRFLLGQDSDQEAERLEAHLSVCQTCLAALHEQEIGDSLLEIVREQSHAAEDPNQELVRALIERVRGQLGAVGKPPCADSALLDRTNGRRITKLPNTGGTSTEPLRSLPRTLAARVAVDLRQTSARDVSSTTSLSELPDYCDFLSPPIHLGELGVLGPYRVLRVLGAGGMGVVFEAVDPQLERRVALKAMLPSLAVSNSARQRFLREARAAAAIEHASIVSVYHVGEARGVPFLAMPFLQGEPLDRRLAREKTLPTTEVLRIGREIAEGLVAAHAQGLIHRDIKPANLWLEGEQGHVRILDFGLARSTTEKGHLTQSGVILGTPSYMAPEQATGKGVDARCDLFSLGCVLYHMTTGELPFQGETPISILLAVTASVPQSPCELNPKVPAGLAEFILRLLAKDPAARPPTAEVVVKAILALEAGNPSVAPMLGTPPPAGKEARSTSSLHRLRKWPLALAAGTLLAILGALVYCHSSPGALLGTTPGQLVMETEDPNLAVRVKKGGQQVKCLDLSITRETSLPPGTYSLELVGGRRGLRLAMDQFTLSPGDRKVVRVYLVQAATQRTPAETQGMEIRRFAGHGGPITALTYAPNGQCLVSGSYDCTAKIWDVKTGQARFTLNHRSYVYAVAWSPTGKEVASAGENSPIKVWAATTGALLCTLPTKEWIVTSLAYSPDGRLLASAGTAALVRIWDTATRKERHVLKGFPRGPFQGILSIGFSPDGKRLAAVGRDDKIWIWEVASERVLLKLGGHEGSIAGVAFSPDGKRLASLGNDRFLRLWNADTGVAYRSIRTTGGIRVAFSPDSRQVAYNTGNGTVKIHDVRTGEIVRTLQAGEHLGQMGATNCVVFSPDGSHVAAGTGGDHHNARIPGSILVWSLPTLAK